MNLFGITMVAALLAAAPADDAAQHVDHLLKAAFPEGSDWSSREAGSREAFLGVLESELFAHAEVGPFDVYALRDDGFADEAVMQAELDRVVAGLLPTVPVMERHFSRAAGPNGPGLISGRRLPIVLAHSERGDGQLGFDRVVALLNWAEDDYSGYKQGGNPIYDPALLEAITVRTWEVQVFNLAHEFAIDQGEKFYDHGLGYFTLAHVAARVLRQGAWGMVPPWLAQGLTDELDLEAYETAWVGGDWWDLQRPGWFRPGWSGFLPTGASPPPVVRGPPANLAVTIRDSGDSWAHRKYSTERHWSDLVTDRKSEAPASFEFMADNESFLPRDRALARATLNVIVEVAKPQGRPGLLELLDRVPSQSASGMFDSDPITVLVSDALGGVEAVVELERLSLGEMLESIGKPEIAEKLVALGAKPMLRIPDHREQAEWLYYQQVDMQARGEIWNLILEAEYYQQLVEWAAIGEALDRGMVEAFKAAKRYPAKDRDRQRAAKSFWKGVQG